MLDDHALQSKIAIIGMSCRVPEADTPAAFWHNIVHGVESIRTFTDEELKESGIPAHILNHPHYVKRGAVVERADHFDADFFQYTAKDAEITDPQHRLFLECAWEALEDASCVQDLEQSVVGVYASSCISTYVLNLYSDPDLVSRLGHVQIGIGNEKDFLASKVSFKLGLRGPSVNVQTACSSSLVAVHLASQSLLNGECDLALAGGVTIRSEQMAGYLYQKEGMVSPDGYCRVFDADSRGTVFGNGLGIVVLKRLADAIRDRDNIQAVICGTAVNNDGDEKIGFTAPSPIGQAQVIHEALTVAGVSPHEISYIETHGTGTELGDAIEIKALKEVLHDETNLSQFCAIGSVKPNIGHLDTAAGIIGLIKTTLALKNKMIPPCINHETPNPKLVLEQSPFYVNTKPRPWKEVSDSPKAGVSSFGIGGTNAHVILEEPPSLSSGPSDKQNYVFLASAKTETSLEHTCKKMADFIREQPTLHPADVAYTLQTGRKHFPYRKMVVCSSLQEAAQLLAKGSGSTKSNESGEVYSAFSFSEQKPAMHMMGYELYQKEKHFARTIDTYFSHLHVQRAIHGLDLERILTSTQHGNQDPLYTEISQFFYQCALADYVASLGIKPEALIAQGSGVFAAVYLTRSLSMSDLIRIIRTKHKWLSAAEEQKGQMEEELSFLLQTLEIEGSQEELIVKETRVTEESLRRKEFWLSSEQDSSTQKTDYLLERGIQLLIEIGMESEQASSGKSPRGVSLLRTPARYEAADSFFYRQLGEIWLHGGAVDWQELYSGEIRKRVSLPTYAFDRQRYWFEKKEQANQHVPRKKQTGDWLYRPIWKQYIDAHTSSLDETQSTTYLLFVNEESGIEAGVKQALLAKGNRVCTVKAGQRFTQINRDEYEIHPGNTEHYLQVFRHVFQTGCPLWKIVHMWGLQESSSPTHVFDSLLHMGKSFGMIDIDQQIQVHVVTSAFQSIMGNETLAPQNATAMGAVHVIPQEYQNVRTALIDMLAEDVGVYERNVVSLLVEELVKPNPEKMLAIRGRHKWVRAFEPLQIDQPLASKPSKNGVHLILGGLGDIGLTAARFLAEQGPATIILTGRSAFPPEAEWQDRLAQSPESDRIHRKIRKLMELKELGAQVHLHRVEVSDEKQMNELFANIENTYGRLQGVVYSAGTVVSDFFHNSITNITHSMCEAEFTAKMKGLIILEQVIREKELEYCLVNSSISTILGGIGLVAYTAANQFMNSFVQKMNQEQNRTKWMAVDWDAWNFSTPDLAGRSAANERLEQLITPEEGKQIFSTLFSLIPRAEHIVVSTAALEPRLDWWVNRLRKTDTGSKRESRKELSIEQLLQETIKEAVGLAKIGLDDNFFDTGITSMDIVGMNDAIQKHVNKPILISSWFEYPTVKKLAGYLKGEGKEAAMSNPAFDRSEIVHKGMDKLKMLRNKGREVRNG